MNQPLRSDSQLIGKLESELANVSPWTNSSQPREIRIEIPDGWWDVMLRSVDTLACSVDKIDFSFARSQTWTTDELAKNSAELSRRLNYLLEPISPIEFDREASVLQLRSNPPSQVERNARSYYELLMDTSRVCLVRFVKRPKTPRQPASMTLTREVLGRVLVDITSVIA